MNVIRHLFLISTLLLIASSVYRIVKVIVINEVDALTTEAPQFVELYGSGELRT